jgi:hypothetical protein
MRYDSFGLFVVVCLVLLVGLAVLIAVHTGAI